MLAGKATERTTIATIIIALKIYAGRSEKQIVSIIHTVGSAHPVISSRRLIIWIATRVTVAARSNKAKMRGKKCNVGIDETA